KVVPAFKVVYRYIVRARDRIERFLRRNDMYHTVNRAGDRLDRIGHPENLADLEATARLRVVSKDRIHGRPITSADGVQRFFFFHLVDHKGLSIDRFQTERILWKLRIER